MDTCSKDLQSLYNVRFNGDKELEVKNKIWKTLCDNFFNKYITNNDVVADIASGYCEFINNISAKEKYAIDLNPDVKYYAANDVKVMNENVENVKNIIPQNYIDVFFISNFLEHMNSREEISNLIVNVKELIKSGGRIIILQPNIKYVRGGRYWDFFDHKIPLTENAIMELAEMNDLEVVKCIPKFLPYTTKSSMPKSPKIIWLYLKLMPFSNGVFGEQSFIVLKKK